MIFIIGLGNPGEQLKGTRHSIGREMVQQFQKSRGLPDFQFEKKWNAHCSIEGKTGKEKMALLLPDTMMNKSGSAVAPAARFFKIKPRDIFVLHDDADIELGRAKLSFGRHSAGHKGVESVKRALGTWDFWRLRIGIQKKKRVDAMKLVLQKFSPDEKVKLRKVTKKILEGLEILCREGTERAMNVVNPHTMTSRP